MPTLNSISSRENPVVKRLRRLAESSRARRDERLALIDGAHLIAAAQDADWQFGEIVVAESARHADETVRLLLRASSVQCYVLPDALFRQISPVETPSGLLATVRWSEPDTPPVAEADWLVLDGVQDAGNAGTMMRTAAATGVREIILGPGCANAWGPKVLRAAMGAHFVVRVHLSDDLPALLSSYSGCIAATRLDGAESLFETDLRGPIAWLFGAEGQGLSAPVAAAAQRGILIPMAPGIESLNVAAAAAVCLFEQRRQRLATQ
ncbi:TrmH family RNA methyltransferase [Niveibacterium sp.]|uniref:TrmH family RNA methyltransferase n=1 Tax=Niveibacterium sp. TaxID=2017444 RepID=UPI0035AE0917